MTVSQLEGFRKALQGTANREGLSIAIGSGKGGVGKSSFALSLAAMLAQRGGSTRLVDADPGLADLNIFLGINPLLHWGHFVKGEKTLAEVTQKQVLPGLDFVHGFSGVIDASWMQGEAAQKLVQGIQDDSAYAWTIYDVGAGLSEPNLVFLTAADWMLLVLSPELTSLADAYGTLKTVVRRNSKQRIGIVVNQAENVEQARNVYLNLVKIAAQFLGIRVPLLGWIPRDPELPRSLARQKPLTIEQPAGPYAMAVQGILKNLESKIFPEEKS